MPTTVTLGGRARKPVCKCRTKSHVTQAGLKKSSFHVKEFKMKCWICANETEYPFKFGTHGRAYYSVGGNSVSIIFLIKPPSTNSCNFVLVSILVS